MKLCKDCQNYVITDFYNGEKHNKLEEFCKRTGSVFVEFAKYIRSGAYGEQGKYWEAKA